MHCDLICWETDPCLKASYVDTDITCHNKWSEVQADKQKTITKNTPLISQNSQKFVFLIKKRKKAILEKTKQKHTLISQNKQKQTTTTITPPKNKNKHIPTISKTAKASKTAATSKTAERTPTATHSPPHQTAPHT